MPTKEQATSVDQDSLIWTGLSSDEAHSRLQEDGPNAMPDVSAHPLQNALAKVWAPVPWLLPNSWQIGKIMIAGAILGGCFLSFCVAILVVGKFEMGLGIEALQTLSVVAIVYGSQATIYAIRERRHFWGPRPTIWLVLSSVADLLIISTLAIRGIAMAPLPPSVVAGEFAAAIAFGLILDGVKIPVFARLNIS